VDHSGHAFDATWIELQSLQEKAVLVVANDECGAIPEECPSGFINQGSFKAGEEGGSTCDGLTSLVSYTGQLADMAWTTLCSDGSALLVIAEDECGELEPESCPKGYVAAGSFYQTIWYGGTCPTVWVCANDYRGRTLSIGWLTLCARNGNARMVGVHEDCW